MFKFNLTAREGTAPFIKSNEKSAIIYADILISMIPIIIWSVILFGTNSLLNVLVGAVSAAEVGVLYTLITKHRVFFTDLHSVITGVLVALCLPASMPIWWVAVGAVCAEALHLICAKLLPVYLNPTCTAVIAMRLLIKDFPEYVKPLIIEESEVGSTGLSVYALDTFYSGSLPADSLFDLILGRCAGPIGTVSVVLIIIGAIYLSIRRVIRPTNVILFIAAAAVVSILLPVGYDRTKSMFFELFSGSIFFGAVYLSTDMFTSPKTRSGRAYAAIAGGAAAILSRLVFTEIDGVFPAILLVGFASPVIDYFTRPKPGKISRKALK